MTKRTTNLIQRTIALGFTSDEAWQLRRISRTLSRWGELECGTDAGHIERDEATGRPRFYNARARYVQANDPRAWSIIPDREAGALKRLHLLVAARNFRVDPTGSGEGRLQYFHQSDPRGCALYLVRASDIRPGEQLDSVYSRGLAVCE
jgi:hypothetical protein